MDTDDDDPAPEWFEAMPTVVQAPPGPLPDTSPHRSLDWLGGRESGFSEGVRRAVAAVAVELARAGYSVSERTPILLRIIEGAQSVG